MDLCCELYIAMFVSKESPDVFLRIAPGLSVLGVNALVQFNVFFIMM